MKYIFINSKIIVRKEKDGNYLLIGEGAKYHLVINETGHDVFEVLDKYDDTEDVIKYMREVYPKVDIRVLQKDIFEILKCFEVYGIIEIEDDKENITHKVTKYIFNGDIYYKKVNKFILNEIENDGVKLCSQDKDYYSILSMRMRVMQNREYQIFVEEDGICAYAAVTSSPVSISKVLVINEVIFRSDLTDEQMIFYLNGIINRVYRMYINQTVISKIRVSLYDNNFNCRLVQLLKKLGFEESVCLKDETVLGDLHFYDCVINK